MMVKGLSTSGEGVIYSAGAVVSLFRLKGNFFYDYGWVGSW